MDGHERLLQTHTHAGSWRLPHPHPYYVAPAALLAEPPPAQAYPSTSSQAAEELPPCPFPLDALSGAKSPQQLTPQKAAQGYVLYREVVRRVVEETIKVDDGVLRRSAEQVLLGDFALSRFSTALGLPTWAFENSDELDDLPLALSLQCLAQRFLALLGLLGESSAEKGKLPPVVQQWVEEGCLRLCANAGKLPNQDILVDGNETTSPRPARPAVSPFAHIRLPPIPQRRNTTASVPPPTSRHSVNVPHRPPSLPTHLEPSKVFSTSPVGPSPPASADPLPGVAARPLAGNSPVLLPAPSEPLPLLATLRLPIPRAPSQLTAVTTATSLTSTSRSSSVEEYDPLFDTPPASALSPCEPSSVPSLSHSHSSLPEGLSFPSDPPDPEPEPPVEPTPRPSLHKHLGHGLDEEPEKVPRGLDTNGNENSAGSAHLPLKRALEKELEAGGARFELIGLAESTLLKKRRRTMS